jgi:hypothetical protein
LGILAFEKFQKITPSFHFILIFFYFTFLAKHLPVEKLSWRSIISLKRVVSLVPLKTKEKWGKWLNKKIITYGTMKILSDFWESIGRISLLGANTMPPESRSNAFTTRLVCSVFIYSKVIPQQCTYVYAHVGISLFSFSTFGTLVHQSPSSDSLPIPIPLPHQFFFPSTNFLIFWEKNTWKILGKNEKKWKKTKIIIIINIDIY